MRRSDVRGFASPSQISAAIRSLMREGLIIRLDRGVYVKPDHAEQSGEKALLEQATVNMEKPQAQDCNYNRARRARRLPSDATATYVRQLAKREGIKFTPTYADLWAQAVTTLAGDEVKSDKIDDLLVALTRAGKLSPRDMTKLVIAYHRDLARV